MREVELYCLEVIAPQVKSQVLLRSPANRLGLVVSCERSEIIGDLGSGCLLVSTWWKFN